MNLPHLAQRLFNTPLAIHPRKAEIAMYALADRLGVRSMVQMDGGLVAPMAWDDDDDVVFASQRRSSADPGYDLAGPVALIGVTGTLVQKLGSLRPFSGMTGYDGLRQAILTAATDDEVKGIALMVDSGGGEVAGCFDLVDTIHSVRGTKPIWAICDESAYSAAYAIASAADYITVPRTGGVGSVGVICMHVDWSDALTKAGIKVTFVTKGAKKANGHAELPLSDSAFADMQRDIDEMGALFDQTVARNRGMALEAVTATEAGTFMGPVSPSASPTPSCRPTPPSGPSSPS